jgi:predicted Rossmann fold nucleotide-binding protein DprA/Smf involved in DNA uptake
VIVDQLTSDPISIDAIVDATGLDVAAIMSELTVLTLRGVVKRVGGQMFCKARTS